MRHLEKLLTGSTDWSEKGGVGHLLDQAKGKALNILGKVKGQVNFALMYVTAYGS